MWYGFLQYDILGALKAVECISAFQYVERQEMLRP